MTFETARGVVHAWQCDHMGYANLRASNALRCEIRMAGVQQNIAYCKELLAGDLLRMEHELLTRKPRPFPPAVQNRAAQLLHGGTA